MAGKEQHEVAIKHINNAIVRLKTVCATSLDTEFSKVLKRQYRLEALRITNFARDLDIISQEDWVLYCDLINLIGTGQ